jgi:hypothetical protein
VREKQIAPPHPYRPRASGNRPRPSIVGVAHVRNRTFQPSGGRSQISLRPNSDGPRPRATSVCWRQAIRDPPAAWRSQSLPACPRQRGGEAEGPFMAFPSGWGRSFREWRHGRWRPAFCTMAWMMLSFTPASFN